VPLDSVVNWKSAGSLDELEMVSTFTAFVPTSKLPKFMLFEDNEILGPVALIRMIYFSHEVPIACP
jgi:hypothetical protein